MIKSGNLIRLRNAMKDDAVFKIDRLSDKCANLTKDVMLAQTVHEKEEKYLEIFDTVLSAIMGVSVDGNVFPDAIVNFKISEDNSITITTRSRQKSPVKFNDVQIITIDNDLIKNTGIAILKSMFYFLNMLYANSNLDVLNEVLDSICESAKVPYKMHFKINQSLRSHIISASDTEVVFNATITGGIEVATMGIMVGGDEYNDFVREQSIHELTDSLSAIPTVGLLIKSRLPFIKRLTDISTRKNVGTLLRETYHKNVEFIDRNNKDDVFYFSKKEIINGSEVNIFALIEKKDGNKRLILSPIDAKTGLNVDYDVMANI